MAERKKAAQTEYEAAVKALAKFCEDRTELAAIILDDSYPIRVQFLPDSQLTLFGDDNVDENGEVNDLTVTVGLSTSVKSTLKFRMDAKLLKKLIKLAEAVGTIYYQAYREKEGARQKATRPDYEDDMAYCPECRHEFEEGVNDWESAFCPDCGQRLDWTQEPEETEAET